MLRLFVLSCLCSLIPVPTQEQVISARGGMVSRVQGDVVYRCHDGQKLQPLNKGLRLHEGDTVMTDGRGRVELQLNPDSYLQVAANSSVKAYGTALDRLHFDVERGEVFLIVKSLDHGAALVIHTPSGLLTIHEAGEYRIRVAADEQESEAAVRRGELRFTNADGKVVSVKRSRRVRFYGIEKKHLLGKCH